MSITWATATQIYINSDDSFWPIVMYGATNTGLFGSADPVTKQIIPDPGFALGTWRTVDLKPYGVTADAIGADIGGIEIVTGSGDLFIAFRAPGTTAIADWTSYQQQLLSAGADNGARSTAYDTVPLVNGCFQYNAMAQNYPDTGTPPGIGSATSIGWNLKLKKWYR